MDVLVTIGKAPSNITECYKLINKLYRQKHRFLVVLFLGAIAFLMSTIFSSTATAKLFDGPVDLLPVQQRVDLRKGNVILLGDNGKYTCRVLVKSSMDDAWQVLTDYDRFAEFLPGVSSSALLENNGDRKVFEQTNKVKALVFNIESRVEIATTETYPQEIAFEAIDGDLKTLNGSWILEPVSPYPSAPPDQVLITHQVVVEPGKTPSDSLFFGIYEDSLEETLLAIKQETEKRSNGANSELGIQSLE
ncbi:SRPBCC family protein [Pleurocapsa sp. PCC 7319]|uniref:SRPBCC family protein n=1 Tax=Pleurocapsa sp. PCC 7319 TaxID=118161 RepID=UPI00037F7755|nr:SRPBCC family protein [Pleurocapsa sp. PCC 7319]